jgi:hypothetical protein
MLFVMIAAGLAVLPSGFQLSAQTTTAGLHVESVPSGAQVILDGGFRGTTPLVLTDIGVGVHEVLLKHEGYYDLPIPVYYNGAAEVIRGPMQRIAGIVNVSVAPAKATVSIAGRQVRPGLVRLPTGSYSVYGDAFGFQRYTGTIDITSKATVALDLALTPAPFAISKVYDWKKTVNPNLPWFFGALDISFDVTGPGTGEAVILDSQSGEVGRQALKDFATWHQSFRVNLKDSSGAPLPDGAYTLVLNGTGADGGQDTKQLEFTIAR